MEILPTLGTRTFTDAFFPNPGPGGPPSSYNYTDMGSTRKRLRTYAPLYYGTASKVKRKKFKRYLNRTRRSKSSQLKKYQRPELKYQTIDRAGSMTNVAQGGSAPYQYMFPVPIQGTASVNRIGNMIQIYGLTIKGHIHQAYKLGGTNNYFMYSKIRMCVILDKTPGNVPATLAAGTVFDLANSPGLSWAQSSIKNQYASRYTIIKDIYFDLDGIQGEGYNIDIYIPVKPRATKLVPVGNNTQTWEDLITNGYMLWVGCGDKESITFGDSQEPVQFHLHLKTHYIDV